METTALDFALNRETATSVAPLLLSKEYNNLGVTSPFFPGILLSRKPPKTLGNGWLLQRTMAEKNGPSTPGTNLERGCGSKIGAPLPLTQQTGQPPCRRHSGGCPPQLESILERGLFPKWRWVKNRVTPKWLGSKWKHGHSNLGPIPGALIWTHTQMSGLQPPRRVGFHFLPFEQDHTPGSSEPPRRAPNFVDWLQSSALSTSCRSPAGWGIPGF